MNEVIKHSAANEFEQISCSKVLQATYRFGIVGTFMRKRSAEELHILKGLGYF